MKYLHEFHPPSIHGLYTGSKSYDIVILLREE